MGIRKRLSCARLNRQVNKAGKQSRKAARASGSDPSNRKKENKADKTGRKFQLLVSKKLIRGC